MLKIELTTDHPQSSYGIPVLLIGGRPYGPGDSITALELVAMVADDLGDPEVIAQVKQFCSKWSGPN